MQDFYLLMLNITSASDCYVYEWKRGRTGRGLSVPASSKE